MPRSRTIRSANADFQLALALRDNRRQRARQGRFLIEGVRSIDAAVAGGWGIESFWFASGRQLSRWARGLLDGGAARTHVELEPALMEELSAKDETSELVALVDIPADDLPRSGARRGQTGGAPVETKWGGPGMSDAKPSGYRGRDARVVTRDRRSSAGIRTRGRRPRGGTHKRRLDGGKG